ncbi:hypothetical protein B0T16DRAFT_449512 [Cercophora newfieldiana]|uniref:Uncharacterized protein n=1 Tax=Cercophora newfieldiana TaxID=92897 RepID=A0AA39XQU5_9PEZI|nr:hypothetical protein B0T16DRAFT_449512 [Cercophora newfieldiana]
MVGPMTNPAQPPPGNARGVVSHSSTQQTWQSLGTQRFKRKKGRVDRAIEGRETVLFLLTDVPPKGSRTITYQQRRAAVQSKAVKSLEQVDRPETVWLEDPSGSRLYVDLAAGEWYQRTEAVIAEAYALNDAMLQRFPAPQGAPRPPLSHMELADFVDKWSDVRFRAMAVNFARFFKDQAEGDPMRDVIASVNGTRQRWVNTREVDRPTMTPWEYRLRCINMMIHGGDLESDTIMVENCDPGRFVHVRHGAQRAEFIRRAFEALYDGLTPAAARWVMDQSKAGKHKRTFESCIKFINQVTCIMTQHQDRYLNRRAVLEAQHPLLAQPHIQAEVQLRNAFVACWKAYLTNFTELAQKYEAIPAPAGGHLLPVAETQRVASTLRKPVEDVLKTIDIYIEHDSMHSHQPFNFDLWAPAKFLRIKH